MTRRNGAQLLTDREFEAALGDLPRQARVADMGAFAQHGRTSTLTHCLRVARTSFRLARRLHLDVSEAELVRGALLHDYYLYDWHAPAGVAQGRRHATRHPLYALENAAADFALTPKERNIIAAHMWPLPPSRVPASREAWIVCAADKWCSLQEILRR